MDEVRKQWDLARDDDLLDEDDEIIPIVQLAEIKLTLDSGTCLMTKQEFRTLMDSGANINRFSSHFAHMLEDIEEINPVPLGMTVFGGEPQCITQRGYFPLALTCGTTFEFLCTFTLRLQTLSFLQRQLCFQQN